MNCNVDQNNQFLVDFIIAAGGETAEYQLINYIDKRRPEFFESIGNSPSLYKKHFYLFHHLYKLDASILGDRLKLSISATKLAVYIKDSFSSEIAETDALGDFYGDIKNIDLSDIEVHEMMSQFWVKYLAIEKKAEALSIFGFNQGDSINLQVIKRRYKQLVNQSHPDKGGDAEQFVKIKNAMKQLKLLFE